MKTTLLLNQNPKYITYTYNMKEFFLYITYIFCTQSCDLRETQS